MGIVPIVLVLVDRTLAVNTGWVLQARREARRRIVTVGNDAR